MSENWRPNALNVECLHAEGIPAAFIQNDVIFSDFLRFWAARPPTNRPADERFYHYIRARWAEREAETAQLPAPIPNDWQPEPFALDHLAALGIPPPFTHAQIPEFVHYWGNRAESRQSWNKSFVQRVQSIWARTQTAPQTRLTKDIPFTELATDRSWAD